MKKDSSMPTIRKTNRDAETEAAHTLTLPPATDLPNGWRMVRFGDVVRNVNVTVDPETSGLERYIAGEHMETDDLHIRHWGTIGDGYLGPAFHRKFVAGQILYGSRRTYLRKVAVADFDGVCSNTTFVLEPEGDALLPDVLPFVMQTDTFVKHSMQQSRGSTNPYVTFNDLAWYEFPLPPRDEQRRIAELLWAADAAVEAYLNASQQAILAKETYIETWFNDQSASDSNQTLNLEDVCYIQNGQVDPKVEPYRSMIHIAPDDIQSATGRIIEKKTASEDNVISGNYLFNEKAILYSKIRPNLKKVALPNFSGLCSADMYPIYPLDIIERNYLFYMLLSSNFTQYATSNSIRSAIPKINRQFLMQYKFRLPGIGLQKNFVAATQALENALTFIQDHIDKNICLKRVLMNKLTGSLPK